MERTFKKEFVGRSAFLRDIHCMPKEVGGCRIVGPSSKGPEWVIVEWTGDRREGTAQAILMSWLQWPASR